MSNIGGSIKLGIIIILIIVLIYGAVRVYIGYLKNRLIKVQNQFENKTNLLEALMENIPDFIYFKDLDGKFVNVSDYVFLKGLKNREDAIGKTDFDFFSEDYSKKSLEDDKKIIKTGEPIVSKIEKEVIDKGRIVWFSTTKAPIYDNNKKIIGIVGVSRDITNFKQAEELIKYQAYHDALTGLPNRVMFNNRLETELEKAAISGKIMAIIFIDLDRFKDINDSMGHGFGDRLLKSVAQRLKNVATDNDIIARLEGDEFTILVKEISSLNDAAKAAEKIINTLREPFKLDKLEFYITTSIGISIYPHDAKDSVTLLKNADIAMYRAKEEGRNNYQLYSSAMNVKVFERLALESSLRNAIEKNELILYYQPQVDSNKNIVAAEALIRWNHPELGIVSPMSFIPIAEETGLIVPIGEWVLETACVECKKWNDAGHNLIVAVNLSGRQFKEKNLIETVESIINKTGLDPKYLELEITETIAMQNETFTIDVLNKLKETGIKIAVDDFGTGYSSLSYLKKFPIDCLKIDQSFVRNMNDDIKDAAIVNTIIGLAHNLKLKVTAEGVETQEHMDFLVDNGCEKLQGYLFSRPVPAEKFVKLLKEK